MHIDLQYEGETELEVMLIRGNPVELKDYPYGWVADQDWFDVNLGALPTCPNRPFLGIQPYNLRFLF